MEGARVWPDLVASGNSFALTTRIWLFIGLLTMLTGTMAHGLIVYAQHSVALSTISIAQVAQPALAVVWSVVLLSQEVNGRQIVGMVVVVVGLVLVSMEAQRQRR